MKTQSDSATKRSMPRAGAADTGDAQAPAYLMHDREREQRFMDDAHHRFRRILAALPPLGAGTRLLDIGTTPFTFQLQERRPECEVWTVDPTALMEERCRAAGVRFAVCDLDGAALPFEDDFFDAIVFTEVLEHVFAPHSEVLAEIHRVLAPGGLLILSVPNIARLSNRVRLMFGRSPLPAADVQLRKDWVHGHGHLHEYTRREIVRLCRGAGFAVDRTHMISPGLRDLARRIGRTGIGGLAYGALVRLVPAFRRIIHLECRKP
jgi:SAM-dependent methyltransferase